MHGLDLTRDTLPSAFRYHLTIIPFLCVLWILFNAKEISDLINTRLKNHYKRIAFCFISLVSFIVITSIGFTHRENAFIAIFGQELSLSQQNIKILIFICLVVFPFLFILSIVFNQLVKYSSISGYFLMISVLVAITIIRSYGFSNSDYVDFSLKQKLYDYTFSNLNAFIEKSKYSDLPKSYIPISKGFISNDRGINDKMLPLIELTDHLNGRSFFHWRYSYSRHTSEFYTALTQFGSLCFFPPVPRQLDTIIYFSKISDSPFLISADSLFVDSRLELLGSVNINDDLISKYPHCHNGLTGDIHLFVIKDFSTNYYSDIQYKRTKVKLSGLKNNSDTIKLPISYFENLEIKDKNNKSVPVLRGNDGFAYVINNGNIEQIEIKSFSWLTFLSLISPIIGLLVMIISLFICKNSGLM